MGRLRAELRRLRRQYQEQTEMSKREFMNVHSKKGGVFSLQDSFTREFMNVHSKKVGVF